jgi:gluconolactonase
MTYTRRHVFLGISAALASGSVLKNSALAQAQGNHDNDTYVKIEMFAPELEKVLDPSQKAKILASGYKWSEGPTWDRARGQLYFTDVPSNKAFVWNSQNGVKTFLDPSGASPSSLKGFREPGANGLLISNDGRLLICNHGKRALEAMDIETGERVTLVSDYNGHAFNSPNDLIEAENGDIYFTDPPYGLEGLNASPLKEMKENGVYRLSKTGQVERLIDDMTFPNGVALSPDEKYLYVTQSDPDMPIIRRVELSTNKSDDIWVDMRPYMKDGPGLPDGLAVTSTGHMFVTGPGGVLILDAKGGVLGRINTGRATANCTFGNDGYTLFITAQDRLLSIQTKTKGLAWA